MVFPERVSPARMGSRDLEYWFALQFIVTASHKNGYLVDSNAARNVHAYRPADYEK